MGASGHPPRAWQPVCYMALALTVLNILPTSRLKSRGCPSCPPSPPATTVDSTDQCLTTSGASFLSRVQPGETNRFQTPTLVLKQKQFSHHARCSAEHRTNCFKHRAREAGWCGILGVCSPLCVSVPPRLRSRSDVRECSRASLSLPGET